MKTIKEIYWHDANYPDDTQWLSKKDVLELIDEVCHKGCPDIANLKARIEG